MSNIQRIAKAAFDKMASLYKAAEEPKNTQVPGDDDAGIGTLGQAYLPGTETDSLMRSFPNYDLRAALGLPEEYDEGPREDTIESLAGIGSGVVNAYANLPYHFRNTMGTQQFLNAADALRYKYPDLYKKVLNEHRGLGANSRRTLDYLLENYTLPYLSAISGIAPGSPDTPLRPESALYVKARPLEHVVTDAYKQPGTGPHVTKAQDAAAALRKAHLLARLAGGLPGTPMYNDLVQYNLARHKENVDRYKTNTLRPAAVTKGAPESKVPMPTTVTGETAERADVLGNLAQNRTRSSFNPSTGIPS